MLFKLFSIDLLTCFQSNLFMLSNEQVALNFDLVIDD